MLEGRVRRGGRVARLLYRSKRDSNNTAIRRIHYFFFLFSSRLFAFYQARSRLFHEYFFITNVLQIVLILYLILLDDFKLVIILKQRLFERR